MSYFISPVGAGVLQPEVSSVAAEVMANVANILSTRKQSCPLFRDFGLPMNFIDMPINKARTIAVLEVTEALRDFEPRATLVGITFAYDSSNPGKLIPTVEVDIDEL